MTKTFCDKCGREIKNPFYIYVPAKSSWSKITIDYQHSTNYMLCKGCLVSFAEWLGSDFLFKEYRTIEEK
jgi:hypothetical protein